MPCDTIRSNERQTLQERITEVQTALVDLKKKLTTGTVKVTIGANGAVAFQGWNDRKGLSDVCAYRSLSVQNCWELKQAVLKAEAMSGRKINPQAVAAGVHSHDGGKTWDKGH